MSVKKQTYRYSPKQGDVVYVDFTGEGSEIKGARPAIIINSDDFYRLTKNIIVCPISRTESEFPLHIKYDGGRISGYIKCEQLKALDPVARKCSFVEQAANTLTQAVSEMVISFIGPRKGKLI